LTAHLYLEMSSAVLLLSRLRLRDVLWHDSYLYLTVRIFFVFENGLLAI